MGKILLDRFESIGPEIAKKLQRKLKIGSVDDFLRMKRNGQLDEIKNKLKPDNIDPARVDKWAEMIELFTIPTLSAREAELLQNIEINSVEELAHRDAVQILSKLRTLDEETYFILLQLPTIAQIETWIYYAKLMTRRMKIGYNIPLISLFPTVKLENAVEFQKYRIWTLEDFEMTAKTIPDLRSRVDMTKKNWDQLLSVMEIVKLDLVDVYFARVLFNAGFTTLKGIQNAITEELYQKVKAVQATEKNPVEIMTKELIENIKKEAATLVATQGGK